MDLEEEIEVKLVVPQPFSPALVATKLMVGCPDVHPNVIAELFARLLGDEAERLQKAKRR